MPRPLSAGDIRGWEWPGPPPGALLMHGIGNYGRYWDLFAEAVAAALRLVAPHARGHGDSPKPPTGYAPDDFVRDAVAVMDATALVRPIVVGHSMGGFHAAALTLAQPDRVRALVLVDVGSRVEQAGMSRARRLSMGRPDRFPDGESALAYLHQTSPGYSDAVYENRMAWVFRRDDRGGLVWRSSKDALAKILCNFILFCLCFFKVYKFSYILYPVDDIFNVIFRIQNGFIQRTPVPFFKRPVRS
ncbi:MAG: alpha/beta hydrolase, partial [Chloroflexota bacterium]